MFNTKKNKTYKYKEKKKKDDDDENRKPKVNYYSAKSYAIFFLAKREYSAKELYDKMKLKEYPEEEISEALTWVKELNYQSDLKYAISKSKQRAFLDGNIKLKQTLKQKGISDLNIEKAMKHIPSENNRALSLMEKYKENKNIDDNPDLKTKDKIIKHILSKGFSYDSAKYAYREIFS